MLGIAGISSTSAAQAETNSRFKFTSCSPQDDQELIMLGVTVLSLKEQYFAAYEVESRIEEDKGTATEAYLTAAEHTNALNDEIDRCTNRMRSLRPRSSAGLQAKAKILKDWHMRNWEASCGDHGMVEEIQNLLIDLGAEEPLASLS